jgi:hypothetical protein
MLLLLVKEGCEMLTLLLGEVGREHMLHVLSVSRNWLELGSSHRI